MGLLFAVHGALAVGILWSVMTLGVYITFRILDIADLTVDGSFATGGAVSGVLIAHGVHPLLSLLAAFAAGMLAGLVTGLLHTKIKIHVLLASILTMIALYSVNIRIMGKANTPLLGVNTVLTFFTDKCGFTAANASLAVGAVFVACIVALMYWFFGTEIGSAMRATGNNERMVRALGVNTDTMKMLGLMLANGFVALSGGLVAQSQGYADVGMGTGVIVIGLASIIIGEVVFGKRFAFWYTLLSVVFGSVIYRIVIAIVLQLGLKSTDLKLFTAIIVAASLSVPVVKGSVAHRRRSAIPGTNASDAEVPRDTDVTDTAGK
ncbi:ABC transporter permease [Treponema sp. Marseille-Q4130]|uniref:ABC transporter permease n=1 Tax=Treponema sp. Marseille-Q4130 TaxID=2766702 RepID=UPI0016528F69|nr:ABC transporter permease [Treponema sp. Marseille-Q4130]MBC6720819.1 ABC transporter permease [Treponema sp. Marseille-Q4130]